MGWSFSQEPCTHCGYKSNYALSEGQGFAMVYYRVANCNSCKDLVSIAASHKNLPDFLSNFPEEMYLETIKNMSVWFPPPEFDACPNCNSKDLTFVDTRDVDCPKCGKGKIKLTMSLIWD